MEWHLNQDVQVQFADLEKREEGEGEEASMNVIVSGFEPQRWRPKWVSSLKWRLDTGQDPGSGFEIDEMEMYQRFKTEMLCA